MNPKKSLDQPHDGPIGNLQQLRSDFLKKQNLKNYMKSIKTFCDKLGITEGQFYGTEKVSGYLYLRSLTSIPEGFNPTVGGDLYLSSLTSIPEGFNPTVGGYLDLRSLTSIPEGFNPTVGGDLYLSSLTSIPEGFNPTVGGYLDLRSLTSIPEGFNPTVGGDLYLSSLTSIPEGFNPTVGGYLDLRSLTSIPEGFNPTVGGYLYLSSGLSAKTNKPKGKIITPKNKLLFWQDGKFVKADGIFTEVVSKKGNSYLVRKLHSVKEFYLVTDGTTHAHGDTLEKAKEDFRFKVIAEKLKKDPIKEDTVITVQYYRIVTGSCEVGVKNWIDSVFSGDKKEDVLKNGIKAKELLPILKSKNAYGLDRFKSLVTF